MPIGIPALHVSSKAAAKGSALIFIARRKDALHSGEFEIKINASFDALVNDYPIGAFSLRTDLSDSVKAIFTSTSVELVNSFGKHTPVIYLTGRCSVKLLEDSERPVGCRYWLMIADNRRDEQRATPDIVGFAITDRKGNRVAYGTGPVVKGDIVVAPA